MIKWDASDYEMDLIDAIAERAVDMADVEKSILFMDLMNCHCNGCPLALDLLLSTDDGTLAHDVFGIGRHVDRREGGLTDCFVPRMALSNHKRGELARAKRKAMARVGEQDV